jgi:hypothetical protein
MDISGSLRIPPRRSRSAPLRSPFGRSCPQGRLSLKGAGGRLASGYTDVVTVAPDTLPDGPERAGPRSADRGLSRSPAISANQPGAPRSRLRAKNAVRSIGILRWWKSVVNLSFLLCLATCRRRSSAWDKLSRSCARRVRCWLAFPSAPALGSTNSAASRLALFVGFTATMAGADFSRPYISDDGSSSSRCGPTSLCVIGRTRDLPVPEQRASAHARVSDHAGPSGHSRSRARPCCLPRSETRRHPGSHFFRGSMAGLALPCRRFAVILAGVNAGLGAEVVRYAFLVEDLRPLLPAGLPAHSD